MKRIGFTLVICAAGFAAFSASSAKAYIGSPTPPISAPACWASACAGGDGVNFVDLLNGNYSWGNLSPVQKYVTTVEQETQVIPELQLVPAFRTIALATTAFSAGYLIGTSINHKWLHINGAGVGNTANAPSVTNTGACAPYSTCDYLTGTQWNWAHVCYGATCLDGMFLSATNYSRNGSLVGSQSAGFLTTAADGPLRVWLTLLHASAATFQKEGVRCNSNSNLTGSNLDINNGPSSSCTNGSFPYYVGDNTVFWIPGKDYIGGGGLRIDQPIQPYTTQPVTVQTGWPDPATGKGINSDAPAYNSGPTNPTPTVIQGGVKVSTVDPNGGAISLPAIGIDPLTTPEQNDLNCRIAPSDYNCPTTSPDGTTWQTDGGVAVATSWQMPDCIGLDVTSCEGMIADAANGAHVTPPLVTTVQLGIGQAVMTLPAGAVVESDPQSDTTIAPDSNATITLTQNPDPMPIVLPKPAPWETWEEYQQRLIDAGFQPTQVTLIDPNLAYGPDEVTGTSLSPNGQYPAGSAVNVTVNPVTFPNGDPIPYPPGDTNNPGAPAENPDNTCNCPPIDFSPLSTMSLGNRFPFGIFTYASAMIGNFNVTPHAPDFALGVHAEGVGGRNLDSTYDVNLGDDGNPNHVGGTLDTYMGYWRDLLSLVIWVGAVWFVGSRVLGFGGSGDPGEAMDEIL